MVRSIPETVGRIERHVIMGGLDLSGLFEMLLALDWRSGNDDHQHQRRNLGAFYTPVNLADAVVARTMKLDRARQVRSRRRQAR